MDEPKNEVLSVLVEIRDTLNRIYTCFEDQYLEIQKKKYSEKVSTFEAMIAKDVRKKIFLLLFDKRHLSQEEIAKTVGITQPTVSKFVSSLFKNGLIEQGEENGEPTYRDPYDLMKLAQK
jgi:predicted XRE-type DNA-binding protein